MHRYSAAGGSSGVPGGGGPPARDASRSSDSSFQNASNFSVTSRRPTPLQPYKLRCEREPLSARLGPPDFYPPTPNCAEEILNKDVCQTGYKEVIAGIEEPKEALLSLATNNVLWSRPNVNRYKESIRKRLRELNNALIRKRKAGQVYGVPLFGHFLAKSGLFPEHRTCGEDFRKKWIEDLSQRKRLRALAEHVPHGYQRRTIFEALIKHDVPLLRATWFVKITYLNQVKPMSIGMSAGGPDKSQSKRVELWTKNVLEYAQWLLDDLCQPGGAPRAQSRPVSAGGDSVDREPDVLTQWRYVVRLAQWHYSEGLLHRTQVVEWTLKQLQEKETVEALELLLPIVLELIDGISSSQTHSRIVVETSLQWLRKLYPSGHIPNVADQSPHRPVAISLVELLRYLLVVIPDTFVALDCFPLPHCVSSGGNGHAAIEDVSEDLDRNVSMKAAEEADRGKLGRNRELVVDETVDLIQKRTTSLARAVYPVLLRNNAGKVVQTLDRALIQGDIAGAYHCVYDEEFCSNDNLPGDWQADVISSTAFNLSGPVNPSELYAVRFICEWAVCDFRDCSGNVSKAEWKQSAYRDMTRVYMAVSILRMRSSEMEEKMSSLDSCTPSLPEHLDADVPVQMRSKRKKGSIVHAPPEPATAHRDAKSSVQYDILQSPSAIHDLIYAWLGQHELWQGDSSERLPLLVSELVRQGLFGPHTYVRQLLCSGVLDKQSTAAEIARASRHRHVLQHLPTSSELVDDDSIDNTWQSEASRVYRIERRLALYGLGSQLNKRHPQEAGAAGSQAHREGSRALEPRPFPGLRDIREEKLQRKPKTQKRKLKVAELKQLIATCLQFPEGALRVVLKQLEKAGVGLSGLKRLASPHNSLEIRDATPGCEECGRAKRLKTSEGKGWVAQGSTVDIGDEDESWWAKKGPKVVEIIKVEPPVKPPPKQTTRGRPKTVRKTQSLAQLATNRIEINQGAPSSHVLEAKVSCPFHQPGSEGGTVSQVKEGNKPKMTGDLHAIGAAMKHLRVGEKRMVVSWLDSLVRNLSSWGLNPSNPLVSQGCANGGISCFASAESGDTPRWRMGEEQLAIVVYIMDVGNGFYTLMQLLLWLLPIAATCPSTPPGHVNRSIPAFAGNKDGSLCDLGEAAILSCLQRYEGVLATMDLLPQALSAGMQRAANVMAAVPGGRAGCSALLCHVRDLLRKYGSLVSVQAWEKSWKSSCDPRLRAELEAFKAGDSEGAFGMVGSMSDDRDDPILPRLTGRLARVGTSMKEIVQRGMSEVMQIIVNKERDVATLGVSRDVGAEVLEDGHQAAQRIVVGIMDAIRQNGGGAPHADAALVANAVTSIVNFAGVSVVNVLESLGYNNFSVTPASASPAIRCGCRILQIHVYCLQLLKDGIGDRQTRMLEVALATESSSIVMSGMGHSQGRAPRSQFHLSPETPELNSVLASDPGGGFGRATMAAAAVSALVAGLVVNGITSLERMVSVLRVKDGLENLQLQKCGGLTSNGRLSAMGGNTKADNVAEAYIHWFRVLIGDCRTVVGGLVADLLGEPTVLGLARLQRSMPLAAVFPPAYTIFAAALRRQQPVYINSMSREDTVIQAVTVAVNDLVAHEPFRDVCLRDTGTLYRLLSSDVGESEYAAMLDMQGLDSNKKVLAMVPLRARLFLDALLDRKMPDDDVWGQRRSRTASEPGQVEQVVRVLDELQAATFHWQWVELRLLLNEQVVLERLKTHSQSAQEAVQAAMQGPDRQQLAECEKTFTEVVLTRLLVRPDAAALYSQAVQLLGKALEEFLILQVKWVLENNDILSGRKSLRQLLESIAVREGFSVGPRHVKSWDWHPPRHQQRDSLEVDEKKQSSLQGCPASPEEGELEDDAMEWQTYDGKPGRQSSSGASGQPFATEKALADLVLPFLARSSLDTRNGFAFELVKQMNNLEQHISNVTRNSGRITVSTLSGGDGILGSKGSGTRRAPRSGMVDVGSPGLGRRFAVPWPESAPVSAAALQTSIWLRLQFLLPLLPIIQNEREQQAVRNMRQTLAPVLLRLLSTRVVQEAADPVCCLESSSSFTDFERNAQAASAAAAASAGEPLFDRLLSIMHAVLSSTWAVWLKPPRNGSVKPFRDIAPFDREAAERMQMDVEHMQVPAGVRARLQATMPLLLPTPAATIAAGPPQIPVTALALLQATISSSATPSSLTHQGGSQKLPFSLENTTGKAKAVVASPDPEVEVDPWTLLEDGVGASSGPIGGGEVGNLKACAWLKGAVRVRRTDLTYAGVVNEDP